MHAVACMAAIDRYNPKRFPYPFSAEVAKSVDAVDSKSTVEIRAGSSPAFGTIGTSIDVNGRLFLCLKSSIRKAFLAFHSTQVNLIQSINLLMRVQLRVYPGLDNVCTHTEPLKGYSLWL